MKKVRRPSRYQPVPDTEPMYFPEPESQFFQVADDPKLTWIGQIGNQRLVMDQKFHSNMDSEYVMSRLIEEWEREVVRAGYERVGSIADIVVTIRETVLGAYLGEVIGRVSPKIVLRSEKW